MIEPMQPTYPPSPVPRSSELDYLQRRTIQHEIGDACGGLHCLSCNVDEPVMGRRTYIVCYECGHAYYTARQLRRAYRRGAWGIVKTSWEHRREDPESPWWEGGGSPYGTPLREFLWWVRRALFIRAGKVYFCQHCTHDF